MVRRRRWMLTVDLKRISELQQQQHGTSVDLEPHLKKLNNARRRIVLINNVLQNAQVIYSVTCSTCCINNVLQNAQVVYSVTCSTCCINNRMLR